MIENKWESKLIEKSSNVAISKSGGKKTNFGVIPYGIGLFLPKHPSMIIKKLIKKNQTIYRLTSSSSQSHNLQESNCNIEL